MFLPYPSPNPFAKVFHDFAKPLEQSIKITLILQKLQKDFRRLREAFAKKRPKFLQNQPPDLDAVSRLSLVMNERRVYTSGLFISIQSEVNP